MINKTDEWTRANKYIVFNQTANQYAMGVNDNGKIFLIIIPKPPALRSYPGTEVDKFLL